MSLSLELILRSDVYLQILVCVCVCVFGVFFSLHLNKLVNEKEPVYKHIGLYVRLTVVDIPLEFGTLRFYRSRIG